MRRIWTGLTLAVSVLAVTAATAAAATPTPPPNDDRDNAAVLPSLPATVTGTTAGATVATTDPPARCAPEGGSVWYQLTIGTTVPPSLAIEVDADGNLDAAVDVFVKQRSQNLPVTCQLTDKNGEAVFALTPQKDTTYLIRVAQLADSDSGTFTLSAFQPPAPARPPGATLTAAGARGTLHRVVDVSSAYSAVLRAGTSYAVNLVSHIKGCLGLSIYAPGTRSFADATPVAGEGCEGYRLFTPRMSGRYSFLVRADPSSIGGQPFHLLVAGADASQTTPGLALPNYADVHARVNGSGTGVVRLYRFDVTSRSNLELQLGDGNGKPFDLELLSGTGRQLQCACGETGAQTITAITNPGRFYVAVRARDFSAGPFSLRRRSRVITATATRVDGQRYVVKRPGGSVTVSVDVSARADGPATVEIDRFDPVAGWQYNRTVRVQVHGGRGSFSFTPPSDGQWLFTSSFLGSRDFSPSVSHGVRVLSAGPLTEQVDSSARRWPTWPVPLL